MTKIWIERTKWPDRPHWVYDGLWFDIGRQEDYERATSAWPVDDYPNGFDAYYGNQCADTQYPSTFFEFRAIDLYARAGSRFGPTRR